MSGAVVIVRRMEKERESVAVSAPDYEDITTNNSVSPYEVFTRVESPPPQYDSLSVAEVRPSTSPNRKWMLLTIGVSLGVAVLVGIVTGVTVLAIGK